MTLEEVGGGGVVPTGGFWELQLVETHSVFHETAKAHYKTKIHF